MSDERVELEKAPRPDEAAPMHSGDARNGSHPGAYSYSYAYADADDRMNLRGLWQTVRRRKWLILVIATIITSLVAFEVFRAKSIYEATTSIEIGKDVPTVVRTGDTVIQSDEYMDMYYASIAMKSKIRVLQSRPLLEDVVVALKLDQDPRFLDVGTRRSFWEVIRGMGARGRAEDKDEAELAEAGRPAVRLEGRSIRPLAESMRLAPYVDTLAGGLIAEPLEETAMLTISFRHTDPVLAAAIANTVADVFIKRNFETKVSKFSNTSDWLDNSTRELKAKVQEAEQALANYTREHQIFSTEGKETLTTDKLSRLHDQATRAETDRILKESLYHEVRAGRAEQLPEAFADAKTAALQAKLGELEVTAAELDVKFGPKNPQVIAVQQRMAALQEQIDANRKVLEEKLRADYERAVRDEQSLKAALNRAKGEAVQQNQDAIQYSILRQEVETAKALYTDFLQKTQQAKVQRAEQHSNIRVIDPALVPRSPIGPRRLRTILIALFLSLVGGVGIAYGLERLDNSIKSADDINRYVQLPALGIIPTIGERRTRLLSSRRERDRGLAPAGSRRGVENAALNPVQWRAAEDRSLTAAAEAYRALRTSVLLSAAGNPPKTILVTSSRPGEGKTTTVINTAAALAQLGSSVLIIDCDLRKPMIHKAFNLDHMSGLSTYLSRDVSMDSLIHKLPIENLSILPCGPTPPNPAELISSDKMGEMLGVLAERYDHILIDSPPLITLTDSVILSTKVDGVILVVHGGKSTRDIVRRARQELSSVGAKIFGVVLNNVDLQLTDYDNYYNYYSNGDNGHKESSAGGKK